MGIGEIRYAAVMDLSTSEFLLKILKETVANGLTLEELEPALKAVKSLQTLIQVHAEEPDTTSSQKEFKDRDLRDAQETIQL